MPGNRLVIEGEKKEEGKVEEKDLDIKEIVAGRFERSFDLPEGIKKDQVRAFFQNRVLEVTLPAPAVEPARRIPFGTGETGKKAVKAAWTSNSSRTTGGKRRCPRRFPPRRSSENDTPGCGG